MERTKLTEDEIERIDRLLVNWVNGSPTLVEGRRRYEIVKKLLICAMNITAPSEEA